MSKYIEIDEMISAIKTAPVWTGLDAIERIKALSTIDIVRCKECRYWKWIEWAKEYRCTLRNTAFNARADDFCSYGERKDEPYEYEIKALHKDYVEPYVKIEDEPQTERSE